jgi:hypothetical protein
MVRITRDYLELPQFVLASNVRREVLKSIDGVHAVAVEPDEPVFLVSEALWAEYLTARNQLQAIAFRLEAAKMREE